jgi:hypothetical protein
VTTEAARRVDNGIVLHELRETRAARALAGVLKIRPAGAQTSTKSRMALDWPAVFHAACSRMPLIHRHLGRGGLFVYAIGPNVQARRQRNVELWNGSHMRPPNSEQMLSKSWEV